MESEPAGEHDADVEFVPISFGHSGQFCGPFVRPSSQPCSAEDGLPDDRVAVMGIRDLSFNVRKQLLKRESGEYGLVDATDAEHTEQPVLDTAFAHCQTDSSASDDYEDILPGGAGNLKRSIVRRATLKELSSTEMPSLRISLRQEKETEAQGQSTSAALSKVFSREPFQAKDLDLKEMAESRGFKNWSDIPLDTQVDFIRRALKPKAFLLDPNSECMKYWDILIMFCLVFTSLVTPYEIAFVELDAGAAGTILQVLNRLLDVVFITDMVMQFFLMVKRQTRQGTVWVKSRRQIAKHYLRTWFTIDLFSVLPYDYITQLQSDGGLSNLKFMRLLRVLRLFKLARILKASRLVRRWENRVSMSFGTRHLVKFMILMILACHWMSCVWGFVGILEGDSLHCSNHADADMDTLGSSRYTFRSRKGTYFDPNNLPADEEFDIYNTALWQGHSWVVKFASGRAAGTPSDPCDPAMIYLVSVYWAVVTMTSVGYGDVLPVTPLEYIVCCVCMMASSILWAYIIGAGCAVMSNMDPESQLFEQRLDAFNAMTRDLEIPLSIRHRGREYIREERFHIHCKKNQEAMQSLGADLKGAIGKKAAKQYLGRIWYCKIHSAEFLEDMVSKFQPLFFERRELVELPAKLCIVERGSVGYQGRVLVPWNHWGEDMICTSLRRKHVAVTLSHTEIFALSRDDLSATLVGYPEEAWSFRKAAALLAFSNMIAIFKDEQCRGVAAQENLWIHELMDRLLHGYDDSSPTRSIPPGIRITEQVTATVLGSPPRGHDSKLDLILARLDDMERQMRIVRRFVEPARCVSKSSRSGS
eukprot:gb/GFBE01055585.1/.p1 GENE.gb/GFBE01055585.1/~~gb/GFBE01055585.1/.p1  ORF type:complete len:815 (+),score=146.05 gb/GFBE01055585.1/:1-2445(+)